MTKTLDVAFDRLGQEMRVGSIIAAPYTRSRIVIGRVTRMTDKMLRFEDIDRNTGTAQSSRPTYNKYHNEVICLDEMEATVMFLMTQNL